MNTVIILFGIIIFSFGGVVFFGAPYLPTLSAQTRAAFSLLKLSPGDTVLELGCGDGRVLIFAAEKGYRAVGVELNPFLALVAWLRTRRYGDQVVVRWGNFWRMKWPASQGVFVFLLDSFMPELDRRMQQHGGVLASVTFKVPAIQPTAEKDGVFLYDYRKPHLR